MKVRIEFTDNTQEDEVIIRCSSLNSEVQKIQQFIMEQAGETPKLVFYKNNREFFFSPEDILFFETEGEQVYAHTRDDAYRIKYRLYELEDFLPRHFVRIAKATIVNSRHIYSITRNITSSSLVQFESTHKQVYASRHYYGALKERLDQERGK